MFRYIKSIIILSILVGVLYSCALTKKEIRQANISVPKDYGNLSKDSLNSANIPSKKFFSDSNLNTLIDIALINNQEFNIFLQQIAMAKNEIKARKGEYLPFINYGAVAEVEKVGKYTRNGAVEENFFIKERKAFPDPLTNYRVSLFASWELDVWKKLRNAKKSAVMDYLATVEGKNFMITNLISEIAKSYYELVTLDNQMAILNQNIEIQENALNTVKLQKQAAKATELAVKRFEAEVLKNKSEKYEIKQQIIEVQNKLNFLMGRQSGFIKRTSTDFITKPIDTILAGIPSQLLQNRPDIRRAELELAAAKLDVRVARANFYPSFGIRAGIGLEAFNSEFLSVIPQSLIYSLAGDIVGPLINRNAIKAAYNTANSRQLQAIFEYEKVILNGYLEVSNELSNIQNLKKTYELKFKQVDALTTSIDISNRLFRSARADYMEVLLTQRDALEAKTNLLETKKNQMLARIALYRALGGGWNKN